MALPVRKRAESAIVDRLRSLRGNGIFRDKPPGYTRSPQDNLIPGVTIDDFWDDLADGNGNELLDSPRAPAKFCAAYSSSALAVNTFGPFRHSPGDLLLAGQNGFSNTQFERKCPTPLRGTPPNLDYFAFASNSLVAVESKFLETLQPKKALFQESYKPVIKTLAEPAWGNMYELLLNDPTKFTHLDAAQLVKHYLGIRHTFRDAQVARVLLYYLFWDPVNAEDIPEYVKHRQEVELFTTEVAVSKIRFVALSYRQLWQNWSEVSTWVGMPTHIKALKQRYELSI